MTTLREYLNPRRPAWRELVRDYVRGPLRSTAWLSLGALLGAAVFTSACNWAGLIP